MRRWARLHHAINLLLLTGQRRGELGLASWKEIDFDSATWSIPGSRTKTGKPSLVPLSPWAVTELRALKKLAKDSPWVFPNGGPTPADPKQLTRNLARAQERFGKLGIEPFTLHDLRRTCRTGLARLKIQPHVAERVLNHAQEKIPGTYDVHDYLDEKREALEKWAEHLIEVRNK
jgi:integrase